MLDFENVVFSHKSVIMFDIPAAHNDDLAWSKKISISVTLDKKVKLFKNISHAEWCSFDKN